MPPGWLRASRFVSVAALVLGLGAVLAPGPASAQLPFGEKRYEYQLSDVLPEATVFDRVDSHWRGYRTEARAELVGYVFLTDDLVKVPGYSGETLNTLVGMDTEGTFTGVKIVRHSEPIVLIGLSEATIHEFTRQFAGKKVTDRILISDSPEPGYVVVDAITGATVTAVAENATILDAGRIVAQAEGIVSAAEVRTRWPLQTFERLTWRQLESAGAIGAITVAADKLGLPGRAPAVDLRFAVLDAPSIGRSLLGDRYYQIVRDRLDRDGGSAVYIGGLGTISFTGAGFARGGIFDRFGLDQAGHLFVFTDLDYLARPVIVADGAPPFAEGGVFFTNADFDPTDLFTFRLTVPYRINDQRSYSTYVIDHRLPSRFVESDAPFWLTRWRAIWLEAIGTAVVLLTLLGAFVFRQRVLPWRKLLHRTTAVLAAVVLGIVLKAQPSTTQILTLTGSASRLEFPAETFLSEPLIFMLWIVIAITLVVWGRGFFCGWVCPYGAMLEALIGLWEAWVPLPVRRRIEAWQPPHWFRHLKIVTFVAILTVSFVSLPLAEAIDEVEPFKTFVLHLARPPAFVAYFVIITLLSVVIYRFFCRFLCPLGGALAIPSTRRPLLPLFRYQMCQQCKICAKGCEPRAISFETGRIDYQECLQCWDCQATGTDEAVCPELITARRDQRPVRLWVAGLALVALAWPADGRADVRRVEPGGLAAALAAARDGDVLELGPGVHRGALRIEKAVTLRATDGAILDGEATGSAIAVAAPDVTIERLTIRNCRIDDASSDAGIWVEQEAARVRLIGNTIEGCRFGVWLNGSADAEVIGTTITGVQALSHNGRGDCIHLWDADGARIVDNSVRYCRDGIYMELSTEARIERNEVTDSRYALHTMWCDRSQYLENYAHGNLVGLALMFSERIQAIGNVLHNNRTHGLLWVQVTRGTVDGNIIIGNTKGLFVYNSLYNTFRGNLIARNNLGGHYWGGSEDNVIESNAFVDNEIQLKFVAARDQTWTGNFWSDYSGWDTDDDGRGEVPYRSNTLIDSLLWDYPLSKLLTTSPAFQVLALAEREFPVITFPKVIDPAPQMVPSMGEWAALLERYPAKPVQYYLEMEKLPHLPGASR